MSLRVASLVIPAALTLVCSLAGTRAYAQPSGPLMVPPPGKAALDRVPLLKDVDIIQKQGDKLPLDLPFVDEHGKDVTLGQYFGTRPVVLALVYYECPMLCTQVLNGIYSSMEALPFTTGKEFDLLVVSFDPADTPELAAKKKAAYFERYRRPGSDAGMHFLTGRQESITALTQAVGFKYVYDESIQQFAHPAAITVLSKDAQISQYLYGIEFAPRDLRLALVDAGDGHVGTAVDQVLLYCYHYDPTTGKYGVAIMALVRLGGILTVAILGITIFRNVRRPQRAPQGDR
jgi:protein SCO1/2